MNLIETLLFEPQRSKVSPFLKGVSVTDEERAYFREFLEEYREFKVLAYDLREILCEKVRAILTRRIQKLRDFYDLYMIEKAGLKVEKYEEEIVHKLKPMLRYRRYREAFKRNIRELNASLESMANSYELSLFVKQPDREKFRNFLVQAGGKLREIMNRVQF